MKNLNNFLTEKETEAHKEATNRGLQYRGFGYWADPKTGEVIARSSGDELVDVAPGQGPDDSKGDEETGGAPGQSFDGMMGAGAEVHQGEASEEGAKAEEEEAWKSGPDGDTDVGKDKSQVEDDAFIDKDEDSDEWVSGPDGDNYKTVKSFDKMQEHFHNTKKAGLWAGHDAKGNKQKGDAAAEAEKRGLNSDGHGMWFDNAGNPVAKTVDGALVDLTPQEIKRHDLGSRIPGRTTMRDMMKGKREPAGLMKNRIAAAQGNLAHLSPSEREKYIDDKMATKDGTYKAGKDKGPYHKAMDAQNAVDKFGEKDYAEYKEIEQLNTDAKAYVVDAEYDLSDDNLGEELGDGAFGSVYLDAKGENVIKDGQIGRQEMQALDMLKDLEGFPKLINANFTSGFKSVETWENDGITVEPDSEGPMGQTFWHNAQAAMGRYAMSLADGQPVSDAAYGWDEVTQEVATNNFWKIMSQMHRKGISHNDLHGGNVFFNDDLEPTILDLGLARVDKFSALMEALASQNDNNYQLTDALGMQNLPQETIDQLEENRRQVLDLISEDYSGDEWSDEQRELLVDVIGGDIRLTDQQIADFREQLDLEEDQLQDYIDMLYENLEWEPQEPDNRSELEKRMEGGYVKMMDKIAKANGYSDGKAMAQMFNVANNMHKEKGKGSIPFKGVDITRDRKQNK